MARQHDIKEGISTTIVSVIVQFSVETISGKVEIKVVGAI